MTVATRDPNRRAIPDGPGWRASSPAAISPRGWARILARCAGRWGPDNIVLISGGVSFFVILSAAPALIALVSFYALFAEPAQAAAHANLLRDVLPASAYKVFEDILIGLAQSRSTSVALGFFVSLLFALWGANSGMRQFCAALTIVQDETTERSLATQIAVSAGLTVGSIFIFAAAALIVTLLPIFLEKVWLGPWEGAVYWANWVFLFFVSAAYGSVIYRYGPDRNPPAWRWVLPGAIAAAFVWALMSILFANVLSGFDVFNEIYGPLAGVVTMMIWVLLSTIIFLLGGLLNAEAERQTVRDTTDGAEKPMGARGAIPADEVGAHPDLKALRKAVAPASSAPGIEAFHDPGETNA